MKLSGFRRRIELRGLRFDLLLACIAIAMGPLVAIIVWAVTPLEGPSLTAVTVVGSAVFLVVFLSYGAKHKPRALARAIGAEAGWLGFLWVLITPETQQRIYVTYWIMPGLQWVVFVGMAFALVVAGLVACDRAWTWILKVARLHERGSA